jgi:methyltransferase family protein
LCAQSIGGLIGQLPSTQPKGKINMLKMLRAATIGLQSHLPGQFGVSGFDLMRGAGGTTSARYCYSVWLRHFSLIHQHGLNSDPRTIAELGPGGSLGVGFSALLSGVTHYYALDAVSHAAEDKPRDETIWQELRALFASREPIPDAKEFPLVHPTLPSYLFPTALSAERLDAARQESAGADSPWQAIRFICPWQEEDALSPLSVDWLISQAVLEHVDNLDLAYRAMAMWLRPGGVMSHQIDFKCHNSAETWDGHWSYGYLLWRIICGRRPYTINRRPLSTHLRLLEDYGFKIIYVQPITTPSTVPPARLAPEFRKLLTEADRTTSGAYILSVKRS